MLLKYGFAFVILLFYCGTYVEAQSCKTGQLDVRVAAFLKKFIPPEIPLAEALKRPIEEVRKPGPPVRPYPINDVKRIKITVDSIPVLVFNSSDTKRLPIIIDYHGGGFIRPLQPWMEYELWQASKDLNAIVFAVDYRVAPEHKFPAAVHDAYNAFQWVLGRAPEYGGDTSRIVLRGASAGGNLVAVVSQKAKKDGIANKIKLQVMNCPVTDMNLDKYPSWKENATGYMMTRISADYSLASLTTPKDYNNPELSPMLTKDLSGLPPALIFTAEFDPLRDDGIAYGERLRKAGVRVWQKCFPGQIHCLAGLPSQSAEVNEMTKVTQDVIKEVFRQ